MARGNQNNRAIVHRTAKGRIVDMDKLRSMNGDLKALGNANLNARGDKLDSNGRIVKRRDQIVQDYYAQNPNGVRYVSLTNPTNQEFNDVKFETPQEIKKRKLAQKVDAPANIGKKPGRKLLDDKE